MSRFGWTYVDEARTHEVQLEVMGDKLVVTESAFHEHDAASQLRFEHAIEDEWDARSHKLELEARLGMLGQYWRCDGPGGWRPLPRRPAIVDLRPIDLALSADQRPAGLHHFYHPRKHDRVLLALPPPAGRASALVAEFEMESLRPTSARVLHPALALGPLRSLLASEHLRAHEAGYGKLRNATEFGLVYGPDWRERLVGALSEGVRRIAGGKPWQRDVEQVAAKVDDVRPRAEAILLDPRLRRLHDRYLRPGELDDLMQEGDVAIVKAIQSKRHGAGHEEQHLLSILEASLLLRERIRSRTVLDPELVERVQRLAYYLPA